MTEESNTPESTETNSDLNTELAQEIQTCQRTIKNDVVEVITKDKELTKKIVDRMTWLLVYCIGAVVSTICLLIYKKPDAITSLISAVLKAIVG